MEQSKKNVFEGVLSFICRPLYSISRIPDPKNLEYNRQCMHDMSHFMYLIPAVMDVGVHGHLLYSLFQVKRAID